MSPKSNVVVKTPMTPISSSSTTSVNSTPPTNTMNKYQGIDSKDVLGSKSSFMSQISDSIGFSVLGSSKKKPKIGAPKNFSHTASATKQDPSKKKKKKNFFLKHF